MTTLLLNLHRVPDDEAAEVRALLEANGIDFYETRPSRWGISHGGIWIPHRDDAATAKRLLAGYQRERQARARAEYEAARRDGTAATLRSVLREDPARVLLSLIAIALLLALVALPAVLLRG